MLKVIRFLLLNGLLIGVTIVIAQAAIQDIPVETYQNTLYVIGGFGPIGGIYVALGLEMVRALTHRILFRSIPKFSLPFLAVCWGFTAAWIDYSMIQRYERFDFGTLMLVVGAALIWSFLMGAMAGNSETSNRSVMKYLLSGPLGALMSGLYLISGIQLLPFQNRLNEIMFWLGGNAVLLMALGFTGAFVVSNAERVFKSG